MTFGDQKKFLDSIKKEKINLPILVLISSQNMKLLDPIEKYFKSDNVLYVNKVIDNCKKLSDNLKIVKIENGVHDIFISERMSREKAYNEMFNWLKIRY